MERQKPAAQWPSSWQSAAGTRIVGTRVPTDEKKRFPLVGCVTLATASAAMPWIVAASLLLAKPRRIALVSAAVLAAALYAIAIGYTVALGAATLSHLDAIEQMLLNLPWLPTAVVCAGWGAYGLTVSLALSVQQGTATRWSPHSAWIGVAIAAIAAAPLVWAILLFGRLTGLPRALAVAGIVIAIASATELWWRERQRAANR